MPDGFVRDLNAGTYLHAWRAPAQTHFHGACVKCKACNAKSFWRGRIKLAAKGVNVAFAYHSYLRVSSRQTLNEEIVYERFAVNTCDNCRRLIGRFLFS